MATSEGHRARHQAGGRKITAQATIRREQRTLLPWRGEPAAGKRRAREEAKAWSAFENTREHEQRQHGKEPGKQGRLVAGRTEGLALDGMNGEQKAAQQGRHGSTTRELPQKQGQKRCGRRVKKRAGCVVASGTQAEQRVFEGAQRGRKRPVVARVERPFLRALRSHSPATGEKLGNVAQAVRRRLIDEDIHVVDGEAVAQRRQSHRESSGDTEQGDSISRQQGVTSTEPCKSKDICGRAKAFRLFRLAGNRRAY
jgi:hypothetical protein